MTGVSELRARIDRALASNARQRKPWLAAIPSALDQAIVARQEELREEINRLTRPWWSMFLPSRRQRLELLETELRALASAARAIAARTATETKPPGDPT